MFSDQDRSYMRMALNEAQISFDHNEVPVGAIIVKDNEVIGSGRNQVIKNKDFIDNLILNVSNIFYLSKKKKSNSIILNYDEDSSDLFYWYQQLVAESLGKKNKGIFPIISAMPKDNHSLLQLYLDGPKNNFFTFLMFLIKNQKKLIKLG